ncbi:E3 ubiquitin-protein ligase RNF217 isoform X2 [Cynoglossus semilaevis]|uniref:E3 ubiquitin-protein ligase RNF217 isoform X2 n=1 Tax=Cynoglossus semilaevis TaxID=244447 RepID=UPI000496EEE0|nr:probable E3 ubiquitin-protein ligase RNF217 isoform X2 [Cynoglossus semilaevis]
MVRAKPGMEDDGQVTDACKMPSFISTLDEGRARVSRNLPTQTFFRDCGKVERSVSDLSRRVTRSESRFSLDGAEKELGERISQEKDEEEGNNNNNCNGRGVEKRRASAVAILRRNFGVVKSHSLRLNSNGRMQQSNEQETHTVNSCNDTFNDNGSECGDCATSDRETGAVGSKNEPTVEHVYCTVYCIANDSQRRDSEGTSHYYETASFEELDVDLESGRVMFSTPDRPLYTLDDLVDPFGDMAHQVYKENDGAESAAQSCRVCLEDKTIAPLPCCRKAVCDECLKLYVSSQVRVAKPYISCPIPECSGYLEEGVVVSHLATEDVAKYRYFLELNKLDSSTKPCPQCSEFTTLNKHNAHHSEHKYKIQCNNCQFVWCFKCHAPWHNGLKCREYRKGDKLLRTWASVIEHGQRNAQKCPQCKIHIQRTEGCDHMTCTQCNTNFCYRCGERYRHLRFFGDHTSNLSVFGCKYRYLPDKPHLRRLIRGSVCATKVLIAPVVIVLLVVFGALGLVLGLVIVPVYYVCKRRKKENTQGFGRWL